MRKFIVVICGAALVAAAVVVTIYVVRSLPHSQAFYETIVPGQVYRSRQPRDADWAWMQQHLGIRSVIDLRGLHDDKFDWKSEDAGIAKAGMKHVNIPMTMNGPKPEDVARFLDVMGNSADTPALIHCELGRVRSGVMVAVYRMEFQNWSNLQAVDEFLAHLSPDDDHDGAEQFLRAYQRRRIPASRPAGAGSVGNAG